MPVKSGRCEVLFCVVIIMSRAVESNLSAQLLSLGKTTVQDSELRFLYFR